MAHIYGASGAERVLLRECSPRVKDFKDIKPTSTKLEGKLDDKKETFFKELPDKIKGEEIVLDSLKSDRADVEKSWDDKIQRVEQKFSENRWKVWKYVDLKIKEKVSKPKAVREVDGRIKTQDDLIYTLKEKPDEYFAGEENTLINEINQLNRAIKSPDYSGAYGELRTLDELRKLDDSYHVFCDLKLKLDDYIRYRGKRNLRTAQMDFTVVGVTGIYLIEVKNWGDSYASSYGGISPHEQLERAGLVLWVYLKNHSFFYKPRITKVIIPIQNNIQYNSKYRSVLIRNVYNIKSFIENNDRYNLTEARVKKIVRILS